MIILAYLNRELKTLSYNLKEIFNKKDIIQ